MTRDRYRDELASYRYLVSVIWRDLAWKQDNCEKCDDVRLILLKLERIADELRLKIRPERGN